MVGRLPAPDVPDPRSAPSLSWGILGTGWIADRFAASLREHTTQRVVAVGSRSAARAQEFARGHGIETACASAEDLVAQDVDVVYVATGHPDHFPHARLALEAGRPVLIEKPMTPRLDEATALVRLARERGLFMMEAAWTLALPRYSVVRQVLASGMLGDLVEVYANLGALHPKGHRAMDPAQGGGAMNDLGFYTMMFAREVLPGVRVESARGSRLGESGAVNQFNAILSDGSGRLAVVSSSMLADTPTTAFVAGTKATLVLDGPFYQPGPVTVRFHDGRELRYEEPALEHSQLFWEALEVARCIDAGLVESPLRSLDSTLGTISLMEQALESMGDVPR